MSTDRLAAIKALRARWADHMLIWINSNDLDYLIARVEALEKVQEAAETVFVFLPVEGDPFRLRGDDYERLRELGVALDAVREEG